MLDASRSVDVKPKGMKLKAVEAFPFFLVQRRIVFSVRGPESITATELKTVSAFPKKFRDFIRLATFDSLQQLSDDLGKFAFVGECRPPRNQFRPLGVEKAPG